MTLTDVEGKIAGRFMRMTIQSHTKGLARKGIELTVERIMQDISKDSLNKLLQYFTREGIEGMVEEAIRRQK